MELKNILRSLSDCPCGRKHTIFTKTVQIESGLTARCGQVLKGVGFPGKILLVSDENEMRASNGILESLFSAGFSVKKLIYPDMRLATIEGVREVEALLSDVDGLLSVGTGSVNDICRVAAFRAKKEFAIFATAPSMDGFASDTAPIIENNFKTSLFAEQPSIILADTRVLAASPAELKTAGFGDMIAKYIGIFDWKLSHLLTGEYYCPAVAEITMQGVRKVMALADRVTANDEEAAGSIMQGLVLSGIGMKLAGCSRPASGAEHVLSHYWECYKVARGIWPEFHGKKVGVASVLINRIYHHIAERVTEVDPIPDPTDFEEVKKAFDPSQWEELMKLNNPTVTATVDPARLKAIWPEVRRMIAEMLPSDSEMLSLMRRAGAATEPADVHVSPELMEKGLRYHAYMRHRILLTRLLPMLGLDIMDFLN